MKLTACVLVSIVCSATGCFWVTTKSEGEALRKDVTQLQGQISSKEKALDDQVTQLQKVIDEATKVLKRNNADIGADVDQLRNDVRTANGLVTAVNNGINELKLAFDKYRRDNDSRLDGLEGAARRARERQAERKQRPRGSLAPRDDGVRRRSVQRRGRHLQAADRDVPDQPARVEGPVRQGPSATRTSRNGTKRSARTRRWSRSTPIASSPTTAFTPPRSPHSSSRTAARREPTCR